MFHEREFRRLGGIQAIQANVRVIAATNRDLHQAVAQAEFRLDLYYRLNVFEIRIPPLRERREDILSLAHSFLQEMARSTGCGRVELAPAATDSLRRHEWPGNVRELYNALERAIIVCEDGLIRPQDLCLAPPIVPMMVDSTDLNVVERQAIERAMREVNGNKSRRRLCSSTGTPSSSGFRRSRSDVTGSTSHSRAARRPQPQSGHLEKLAPEYNATAQ